MKHVKNKYVLAFGIVVWSCCFLNNTVSANNYELEQLSVQQGIPGSNICKIYQDRFGFMWFGIEAVGLCRYDGKQFDVYGHKPDDPTGLSNNSITDICEDTYGDLWISTEYGLNLFDRKREIFYHFYTDPKNDSSISDNWVITMFCDDRGNMWVGTDKGLDEIDSGQLAEIEKTKEGNNKINTLQRSVNFHHILPDKSQAKIPVQNIYRSGSGEFWVSTYRGIYVLNNSGEVLQHYVHQTGNSNSLINNAVHKILEYKPDNFLIGTDRGICKFDASGSTFSQLTFPDILSGQLDFKGFYDFLMDKNGVLWIGLSEGLIIGTPEKNGARKYHYVPEGRWGLKSRIVRNLFEDKSGQIWIGTKFGGLHVYNPNEQLFPHYFLGHDHGENSGTNNNYVLSIFVDSRNRIWIGTKYRGLFCYNRHTNTYISYTSDDSKPGSLSSNRVEIICQDNEGHICVGTSKGLNILNIDHKTFSFYPTPHVMALKNDDEGKLWIGTTHGIYIYNMSDHSVEQFHAGKSIPFFTNSNADVYCIFEDIDHNIWFGTAMNGLYIYNPARQTIIHKIYSSSDPWSIHGDMIRDIYQDKKGRIWIATKNNGLCRYDISKDKFYHYTKADGLSSNAIYSIIGDNSGNLWLGTHQGLSEMNIDKVHFTNYDRTYGLQSNIFENDAKAKTKGGFLLFGGYNGFNIFDPDSIRPVKFDAPLVITSVKASDMILDRDIEKDTAINLPHNQNYLSFEFALLDFRNPARIRYKYMLKGVDKRWVYAGNRNYVSYPKLPHGNYKFMVCGSNSGNSWAKAPLRLNITIRPPFWETDFAYIIYMLFIFLLLFFIYKVSTLRANYLNRLEHAKKEIQYTMEINQAKLRFFTNISHEFRTPLTLILAPVEKLARSLKDGTAEKIYVEMIQRNTRGLMVLIDQLLYFRKTQQSNLEMKVNEGDIISFVKEITLPFKEVAEEHRIDFRFVASDNSLPLWFDPDKVGKIIGNLLSNAFKYTASGGEIGISVDLEDESNLGYIRSKMKSPGKIRISVRDTGKGMTRSQAEHVFERFYQTKDHAVGTGIGLELTKTLVEMHGGSISVESEVGKGSTFSVYFLTGKEHFNKEYITNDVLIPSNYTIDFDYTSSISRDKKEIKGSEIVKTNKNGKACILIVEDNQDLRNFLQDNLSEFYTIYSAPDGKEGFRLAKKVLPELIISDVIMPEMDGYALCRAIKSTYATCHIPVILLTAKIHPDHKKVGYETGVDDYIEKPFDFELLRLHVRNLVQTRRKLHDKLKNTLGMENLGEELSIYDKKLLDKCNQVIEKNLNVTEFSVVDMGKALGMSRSHLHRKIKALTGQTPIEWIYNYRLLKAKNLLINEKYTVSDVAYLTGFTSPSSFSTVFKKRFGKSPSEFL